MEFDFTKEGLDRLKLLLDEDLKHGEMNENLADLYEHILYCEGQTTLHLNF